MIYRQATIDAVRKASVGETRVTRLTWRILDYLEQAKPAEPGYVELTPEEAASEIDCGSLASTKDWFDIMLRINRMGYSICRKTTPSGTKQATHIFTDAELVAHDEQIRHDFVAMCRWVLTQEEKHDTPT